jgi:hypothetical protein
MKVLTLGLKKKALFCEKGLYLKRTKADASLYLVIFSFSMISFLIYIQIVMTTS